MVNYNLSSCFIPRYEFRTKPTTKKLFAKSIAVVCFQNWKPRKCIGFDPCYEDFLSIFHVQPHLICHFGGGSRKAERATENYDLQGWFYYNSLDVFSENYHP